MQTTKKVYWIAQLLGWFSYSTLILFSVYSDDPSKIDSVYLLNILVIIFSGIFFTHLQRYFFIRLNWLSLRLPKLLPRLLLSALICSILIAFVDIGTDYLTNINGIRSQTLKFLDVLVGVLAVLVLVLFWNAIYFTFHFFQKSREQEISNLELAAHNRESELKNLRSQLNPHFLFNSLNSIKALVDIDPVKSKISITRLSNLLRISLEFGKYNIVPFKKELELVENYLELEKIRFEERLAVEWEIDQELMAIEIPPFVLQMMVENAIKHGISNLINGGIVRIRLYSSNDNIVLEVINSGDLKNVVDLGVGIENIKRRLSLQYGSEATFKLFEENGVVHAVMNLKK